MSLKYLALAMIVAPMLFTSGAQASPAAANHGPTRITTSRPQRVQVSRPSKISSSGPRQAARPFGRPTPPTCLDCPGGT